LALAAVLRADFTAKSDYGDRARLFFTLASQLLELNAKARVAVLVVNQVADVVASPPASDTSMSTWTGEGTGPTGAASAGPAAAARQDWRTVQALGGNVFALEGQLAVASNGRLVKPALGLAWDNCVTTRLMLTHLRFGGGGVAKAEVPVEQGLGSAVAAGAARGGGGGSGGSGGGGQQIAAAVAMSGTRYMYLLRSPSEPRRVVQYAIAAHGPVGV
jgi:hypothetical protein